MNRSASVSRSSVLIPGRIISPIRARVPATIRPARPMMSISRGDFSVIMLLAKGLSNSRCDGFHRARCRNTSYQLSRLIPVEHRGRLPAVGAEARGDSVRIVVGSVLDLTAAAQSSEDLVVTDVEEQHRAQPAALFGQQPLDALRLRDGPDHPVEYYSLASGWLAELLPHNSENQLVTHQVTGFHQLPGLDSQWGTPLDRIPQQVAGGELRDAERLCQ